MKKLYIIKAISAIVVFLLLGMSIKAQTSLPYSTDFSSGIPSGWAVYRGVNGLGTTKDWTTNNGSAFINFEDVTNGYYAEDWLVTPLLTLKQGSNILTFDETQSYPQNYNSKFTIRISTSSQTDQSTFSTILSYDESSFSTSFSQRQIDLSAYASQNIYVAFVMSNDDGDSWYVDNVSFQGNDIKEVNNFRVNSVTNNSVTLNWQQNSAINPVLLVYSEDGNFGEPVDGTLYSVGNTLAGGGIVLTAGSSTTFTQSSLNQLSTYYYKIWSYDNDKTYSYLGTETTGTTTGPGIIENTDFESGLNGWTYINTDTHDSQTNNWIRGNKTSYRGTYSAYVSNDNINPAYTSLTGNGKYSRIYLQKDNIVVSSSYKSAELSFFWKCLGEFVPYTFTRAYGDVYISVDNGAWFYLTQDIEAYCYKTNWVQQVVDLSNYCGHTISLRFQWYNDEKLTSQNPGFCVDDIRIIGSTIPKITSFDPTVINSNDIQLDWNDVSSGGYNVIIAYSNSGTFGTPSQNKKYIVGSSIPGGGQVIYNGSGTTFNHIGSFAGGVHYKIWVYNSALVYSSGVYTYSSMPVSLPFKDNFETNTGAWTMGTRGNQKWVIGKAQAANGAKSAYVSTDNGVTANYSKNNIGYTDLILPVNLKGLQEVMMYYSYKGEGGSSGQNIARMEVWQDNTRKTNFQNVTGWQRHGGLSLTSGSFSNIKFRMFLQGGSPTEKFPGFCLDSVIIDGKVQDPVQTSLTATNNNTYQNEISWTKTTGIEEVIVGYSIGNETIGTPVKGASYIVGDALPGGGYVAYIGTADAFTHTPLRPSTTYNYILWNKAGLIYSSNGTTKKSATTPDNVRFYEPFEGSTATWTKGASTTNRWVQGIAQKHNGTMAAYVSYDGTSSNVSTLDVCTIDLMHSVDLRDFKTIKLKFWYKCQGGTGSVLLGTTPIVSDLQGTSNWTERIVDITSYRDNIYDLKFRWTNTTNGNAGNPGFVVDDILITGTYDDDSYLTLGASSATKVESILDSQSEAVSVFNFSIADKGTTDNRPTIMHQVSFSEGAGNNVDDWSSVIAGAQLVNTSTGVAINGTIASGNIIFTGDAIVSVPNNSTQNFELRIWLNKTINKTYDGKLLQLKLKETDIVAYDGSSIVAGTSIESPNTNEVEITATKLYFATQPSAYGNVSQNLTTQPVLYATDENNNIDNDVTGASYGLSLVQTVTSPSYNMTYSAVNFTNGVATVSNLKFGTKSSPNSFTITASVSGLTAISNAITISGYCTPNVVDNTNSITSVNIGDISNYTSTHADYNNFLDVSTVLTRTKAYALQIGFSKATGLFYLNAWIDYNSNDIFDASERIITDVSQSASGTYSLLLTIPNTVSLGGKRLRIASSGGTMTDACAAINNGEVEDYTIVVADNTWIGEDTYWTNPLNWSIGIPSETDVISIYPVAAGKVYPVIDESLNLSDLTIKTGAQCVVGAGGKLTIDNLTIEGTGVFKIQNSPNDPASFIQNGTITGNVTVENTFSGSRNWYIGHAMNTNKSAYTNASPTPTTLSLGYYNPATDKFPTIPNGTALTEPLRGYLAYFGANTNSYTVKHVGTLYSGDQSITMANGYNLVANPYPCYLDINSLFTSNSTSVKPTVWVRSKDMGYYQFYSYNSGEAIGVGGLKEGLLAPNQAFWVYKNGTSSTLNISSTWRRHGTGTLKSLNESNDVLRLELGNKYISDEIALAFRSTGSVAYSDNDSEKRMNTINKAPQFFVLKDGYRVVIDILPENPEDVKVDLAMSVGEEGLGTHTIAATNITSFMPGFDVFLKDLDSQEEVNLRENPTYTFNVREVASDLTRFELSFKKSATVVDPGTGTDINAGDKVDQIKITAYALNEKAVVNVSDAAFAGDVIIDVYDGKGVLYDSQLSAEKRTEFGLPKNTQVVIVKVTYKDQVKSFKLLTPVNL